MVIMAALVTGGRLGEAGGEDGLGNRYRMGCEGLAGCGWVCWVASMIGEELCDGDV